MSQRIGESKAEAAERVNAARRQRYATDPEFRDRLRTADAARRSDPARREQVLAVSRARARRLMADPEYRRRDRLRRRAKQYGLTSEQLLALGDRCGTCGTKPTTERSLHVDHDHACCPGEGSCGACVRGVLCYVCNSSFERFLDSRRVLAYLLATPAGRTTIARHLSTLLVFRLPR